MTKDHQFLCRKCEREISAPLAAVGQKTRCCLCEAVIVVPTAEQDSQFRIELQRRKEAARLQRKQTPPKSAPRGNERKRRFGGSAKKRKRPAAGRKSRIGKIGKKLPTVKRRQRNNPLSMKPTNKRLHPFGARSQGCWLP